MEIISYSDSWKNKWDSFVEGNPCSWTGHFSGIFVLEREEKSAINHSLLVVSEKKEILALLPLFLVVQHELRFIPLRILTSGTHLASGPLFLPQLAKKKKKQAFKLLIERTIDLGRELCVDQIVISYPNIINDKSSLEVLHYYPLKCYGFKEKNIVPMIKNITAPKEELFSSLNPKCRNSIRRAQKSGVLFRHVTSKDEWMSFYDLNVETLGGNAYSREIMKIIWHKFVMHDVANVTAVFLNDIPISIALTTCWRCSYYYWFGFNSRINRIPGSANLLLWETMLFYKEKGLKFFEVGSMEFSSGKQKRISKFKESFNGIPTYMLSGVLILKPLKHHAVAILKQIRG